MSPYSIPPLISSVLFLALGLFCYLKNRKSKVNISFALMAFTIVWWQGSWTILFNIKDAHIASILVRVGYSGIIFLPATLYHFIIEFLNRKEEKIFLWLSYLIGIGFLTILWTTNLFIRGYYIYYWGYYPKASPIAHPVYLIILSIQVLRILYLLFIYFKKIPSDPIKRNQIKYLFWAIFVYSFAIADFADNYGFELYPLGVIPVFISMSIIGYTIVRYKLMDINIIVRKTLIYSIIIGFLFITSVIILYILAQLFGGLLPQKTSILTLFLVAILALLFQPLYRRSTSLVDRIFFKGTLPKIAEELQRSEKLAALGILASGLAHEIKNPLAPIKTYIQNLSYNANDPKYIEKLTKVIPIEIDKITDTINQLRDFANPPPLSISRINLHNLMDKKLNLLEQDFISRKIEVIKEYSSSISEINADPIQLEKVFLNLFLNAVDAMPNGGKLTISTEINSNNTISIKVSDTGIGIDKKDMPHIFDPFYSKGKQKGMGLGLAVVHQIIKEHGGTIQVQRWQGKGTIFYILLNHLNLPI